MTGLLSRFLKVGRQFRAVQHYDVLDRQAGSVRAPNPLAEDVYDDTGWVTWTVITSVPWYC